MGLDQNLRELRRWYLANSGLDILDALDGLE
jgi:hypothetical protein